MKTLLAEISAGFLMLSSQGMGAFVHELGKWDATLIGEADCKEQFNVIKPTWVVSHMHNAVAWFAATKCCRSKEVTESIHQIFRKLLHSVYSGNRITERGVPMEVLQPFLGSKVSNTF